MKFNILAASAASLVLTSAAFGQASAQASNTPASVVIWKGLTIEKLGDLDFGYVVTGPSAGTVVVPPTGAATATNATILSGHTPTPASFKATGHQGAAISVSVPGASITLSNGSGQVLSASSFQASGGNTGTLTEAGGSYSFTVGAQLNLDANQAEGTYNGTFNVTVAYQ